VLDHHRVEHRQELPHTDHKSDFFDLAAVQADKLRITESHSVAAKIAMKETAQTGARPPQTRHFPRSVPLSLERCHADLDCNLVVPQDALFQQL